MLSEPLASVTLKRETATFTVPNPVTLEAIKANPKLDGMVQAERDRLSAAQTPR